MNNIGIDVSKHKLDCLWLKDPQLNKVKTKVFKNTPEEHQLLGRWLLDQTQTDASDIRIVLEATGVYHEAVAYSLHQQGFIVCVVNPARAKEFAKSLGHQHKTDAKDSLALALFGQAMKPDVWEPEPLEIKELRSLISRLQALEMDYQREFNRLEKAQVSQESERIIESLGLMMKHLKDEKLRLEQDIDDHINRHPHLKKNQKLLCSIPAIGPVLSRIMVSIIHSDRFKSAGQVSAFLGLIPKIQESGLWKGRSRLSKRGPAKVRAKLYMAAIVAIRHNPDIKNQYERLLANGKTKMQALGAAMRKLVQICFGVIKHQNEYYSQLKN